ncbi:hypothetical protein [Campylobacter majalis]|uniref:hypothetical protein n=1 Tax=Campylobacter majalis TaxID=2790656 RepID=UPI003D686CA4
MPFISGKQVSSYVKNCIFLPQTGHVGTCDPCIHDGTPPSYFIASFITLSPPIPESKNPIFIIYPF